MTNFVYPHALHTLDVPNLASADLRAMLLLDGTSADLAGANRNVTALDQFSILDEHVAAGRQVLASLVWAKDATNFWSWLAADPNTWNPLPLAGGQDVKAALVYLHVTDDTDSYPVAWVDSGGYPVTPTGLTRHVVNWHATQGVLLHRTGV